MLMFVVHAATEGCDESTVLLQLGVVLVFMALLPLRVRPMSTVYAAAWSHVVDSSPCYHLMSC